jgi:hypothetical protein
MLRRASAFFGASGDPEQAASKEARERAKRAERLQQRRTQTVKNAAHVLPRSMSSDDSIFDNAPPLASSATEFDRSYETKGKGRRQVNPMNEEKEREADEESAMIDRLAFARGINRAQAKVMLAQNPSLGKPLTHHGSQTSAKTSAWMQSQAIPRHDYYSSPTSSPATRIISPRPARDSASPSSSHHGSPAQQLVRFASQESTSRTTTLPGRLAGDSPVLPDLDFGSPRRPPMPPGAESSPALSLSAFVPKKSNASTNSAASGNYVFSDSSIPSSRYGLGVTLPPARVTTVGGLRGEHAPQPAYNESMIYDAVARAI